jgi:hypothetical protein
MKLLKSQSAEHRKFIFNHSNYFDELYIKNGGFVATNGGTKIIEVNGDGAVTTTTAYTAGTVTSTSANALAIGPAGATAPTFKVNANTGSCATGIEVVGAAATGGVNLRAISSGTNEPISINAKGSGAIAIGDVSTGAVTITPATTITGALTQTGAAGFASTITGTSASASALAIGRAGATNPTLQVDNSTSTCATGVKIKSAAATSGVAVSVISSGTDENLTIDAKGAGTVTIAGTSTGIVTITPATTITGLATLTAGITGKLIVTSTETIAAGGTTTALSLTKFHHDIDADAGGDIFTLADGVQGQIVVCVLKTATGVATITPATFLGGTSITLNAAGDSVMLRFQTTLGWSILGGNSYAIV